MLTARHYSVSGQEVGSVNLPAVFEAPARPDVVYDALRAYLANQRQGTAATKTRSLVSGGGKKPWRQKGTGRARHGSTRSPIWVGGSTVFGPQPRDYSYQIPRKMRRLAIQSVLADRARDGQVVVVDDLELKEPKTKTVATLLKQLQLSGKRVLFVGGKADPVLYRSVRNIAGAACNAWDQISVYDVVACDAVVVMKSALDGLKEVSR